MAENNRVVIVKGIAGLGNRLRVVTAAMEYAKRTNRAIYVDWNDGMFAPEGVNAFNRYFEIVDFPCHTSYEDLKVGTFYPAVYSRLTMNNSIYNYFEKEQMENRFTRKVMHYLFKAAHKLGDKNDSIDNVICRASQSYQAFVLHKNLQQQFSDRGRFAFGAHLSRSVDADAVIYCDNIPFYRAEMMKSHIQLKPKIASRVDSFVRENKLNRKTVGVHVRASGKKCYGDIERFIIRLKKFIQEKGMERVFLCTDNSLIEANFKESFDGKLIIQPKYLPEIEGDETGIHDHVMNSKNADLQKRLTEEAIIDMFALSNVDYLFYQFGSTFSEISCVYHKDRSKCKSWMSL